MEKFGEKLRVLRKRNGLTQKQVGDKLGVSRVYITQMEQGKDIPNIAMLIKIAQLFNVSSDQLIMDDLEL